MVKKNPDLIRGKVKGKSGGGKLTLTNYFD